MYYRSKKYPHEPFLIKCLLSKSGGLKEIEAVRLGQRFRQNVIGVDILNDLVKMTYLGNHSKQ